MKEKLVECLLDFLEKLVEHIGFVICSLFAIGFIALFGVAIYTESIAPTKGVVVDKDYTSGYSYTTYETMYKNSESIQVPVQKYREAEYKITIKGINKKGEEMKYTFEVSPEEYETIQLGDTYIRKLEYGLN